MDLYMDYCTCSGRYLYIYSTVRRVYYIIKACAYRSIIIITLRFRHAARWQSGNPVIDAHQSEITGLSRAADRVSGRARAFSSSHKSTNIRRLVARTVAIHRKDYNAWRARNAYTLHTPSARASDTLYYVYYYTL